MYAKNPVEAPFKKPVRELERHLTRTTAPAARCGARTSSAKRDKSAGNPLPAGARERDLSADPSFKTNCSFSENGLIEREERVNLDDISRPSSDGNEVRT
jgi:hypothetical protein